MVVRVSIDFIICVIIRELEESDENENEKSSDERIFESSDKDSKRDEEELG